MLFVRRLLTTALAAALFSGCHRSPEPSAENAAPEQISAGTPPASATIPAGSGAAVRPSTSSKKPAAAPPAVPEIWKQFSGDKAFAEARMQIEIGPRPSGSAEVGKARALIEESLRRSGWEVEPQVFTDDTPHGPIKFTNIIARFAVGGARPVPRTTQRAIVCSHYDTKYFSTIHFVGASDGASSTGALLELARVLALDPALASKIELVFFDGEEAIQQFTETDGLWGSRHYASQLVESKRAAQFKFGILWDMIGDRDLTITLSPDSPVDLARGILASSETLGLRKHFGYYERSIYDDHVPLIRIAHVSSIDLIDFDYPVWHTADDNLEHISPESLQKVGAVTLHYLRQALDK